TDFLATRELLSKAAGHNACNPLLQIGARNSRETHRRRFDVRLTDFDDSLGVRFSLAACADYNFIAGVLAFLDQSRTKPPDHRKEPEDYLDEHVNCSGEIVAAANVSHFVRHDGVELC